MLNKSLYPLLIGVLFIFQVHAQAPVIEKITEDEQHMIIHGKNLDETKELRVNSIKIEKFNPSKSKIELKWIEVPKSQSNHYNIVLSNGKDNPSEKSFLSQFKQANHEQNGIDESDMIILGGEEEKHQGTVTPADNDNLDRGDRIESISPQTLKINSSMESKYGVNIDMPALPKDGELLEHYKYRLLKTLNGLEEGGLELVKVQVIANVDLKRLSKQNIDPPHKIDELKKPISYEFIEIGEENNIKGTFRNGQKLSNESEYELFRIACLHQVILNADEASGSEIKFVLNTDRKAIPGINFNIHVKLPADEIKKAKKEADFHRELEQKLEKFSNYTYSDIEDVKYRSQEEGKMIFSYVNYEPYSDESKAREGITTFANVLRPIISFLNEHEKLESIQLEFESFDTGSWNNESPLSSNYKGEFKNLKELAYFLDGKKGSTSIPTDKQLSIMQEELLKLQYLRNLLDIDEEITFHLINNEEAYQKLTRVVLTIKH